MSSRLCCPLLLVLALLVGCESALSSRAEPTGALRLSISLPAEASPEEFIRVFVIVSSDDTPSSVTDLVFTEGAWGGIVGELPVGADRTVTARAIGSPYSVRYEGRVSGVTIAEGSTGRVSLLLQDLAPTRFTNEAPILDALASSATRVGPGGVVSLVVRAHDPNTADALSYAWTAPSGRFSHPTQASTTWTAPSTQGAVDLTIRVGDPRGAFSSARLTVTVSPPEGWAATGAPGSARYQHAAVSLSDGRVLVLGGRTDTSALASAELYAPSPGTWTATGSMRLPRLQFTATLLANGKVLVTGGSDGNGVFSATAELYDPASGTWSPTGALSSPRARHTATLLRDGKVLVIGGTEGKNRLATAELYDPASGLWQPAAAMATGREAHTATLLTTGKVLVTGGLGTAATRSVETYDPAAGKWSSANSLDTARQGHTATLLSNGRVLLVGGSNEDGTLSSAEVFEPTGFSGERTASLLSARKEHTAALLPNGGVLVSGGTTGTGALAAAEVYDPLMRTWLPAAAMTSGRRGHAAALLSTGRVLVSGGLEGGALTTAELYEPGPGT